MILRQLFDYPSYTFTYLIIDQGEACLIDPVLENTERYLKLINELDASLVLSMDTHVHADHVTALGELRTRTGCKTIIGNYGQVNCASEALSDGKKIPLGSLVFEAIYTPGHTDGSFCFYLQQSPSSYLFTGDTLLIRGTGRTDFQNGDPSQLYESLHQKILRLPGDTVVFPAHDYNGATSSTIEEEKRHNPRLKLTSKQEFCEYMNNLILPNPKMMDLAVPANLSCGKPG